jgi:hypothetical protein
VSSGAHEKSLSFNTGSRCRTVKCEIVELFEKKKKSNLVKLLNFWFLQAHE